MKNIIHCIEHYELTPSMIIDLNAKTFRCIGCGVKGVIEMNFKVIKDEPNRPLLDEEC